MLEKPSVSEKAQIISSFCGRNSRGNLHQLVLVEQFSSPSIACAHSRTISPQIYVEMCPDSNGLLQLRYYHNDHEVQNCGSGTLAASAYWYRNTDSNHKTDGREKHYQNRVKQGEFLQRAPLAGYSQRGLVLFKPSRKRKNFWRAVCGCPIRNVVEVVDQRYIVIEVLSSRQVKTLRPKFNLLLKSPLALIVTAKNNNLGADYVMRYFAPQYGNKEDAATGSANSLLIQYWWSRISGGKFLHGLQLSKSGGEFFGRIQNGAVELYGKTFHY